MQEDAEGEGGHRGEIITTETQRARSYGGNPKYRKSKTISISVSELGVLCVSVVNISPLCPPSPSAGRGGVRIAKSAEMAAFRSSISFRTFSRIADSSWRRSSKSSVG
jgi:hypothetical protein